MKPIGNTQNISSSTFRRTIRSVLLWRLPSSIWMNGFKWGRMKVNNRGQFISKRKPSVNCSGSIRLMSSISSRRNGKGKRLLVVVWIVSGTNIFQNQTMMNWLSSVKGLVCAGVNCSIWEEQIWFQEPRSKMKFPDLKNNRVKRTTRTEDVGWICYGTPECSRVNTSLTFAAVRAAEFAWVQ